MKVEKTSKLRVYHQSSYGQEHKEILSLFVIPMKFICYANEMNAVRQISPKVL
jgi:hypothetical protein